MKRVEKLGFVESCLFLTYEDAASKYLESKTQKNNLKKK